MRLLYRFALILSMACGLASLAHAAPNPTLTIKIYNDDPLFYVYPVYTTGQQKTPGGDVWLQAIFGNTKAQIDTGKFNYFSDRGYRFYLVNAAGLPMGIAPGRSVTVTIPLYTQLVANPDPSKYYQYADWWNGATIQLFYAPPLLPGILSIPLTPPSLSALFLDRTNQTPLTSQASKPVFPSCVGCGGLRFFSAKTDIAKNLPSQLLEMTLGARVEQCGSAQNPCKPGDAPNTLDTKNVDFDVSYVNVAYGTAAMGPYKNDQVGYVGSPLSFAAFQGKIPQFLAAYPGWPQFVYPANTGRQINKIASPLEIFARMSPGSLPPPDLTPLPTANASKWPAPESLWDPIRNLYSNWVLYAGKVTADGQNLPGQCQASDQADDFCGAVVNVKKLFVANYEKYKTLFGTGKPCGSGAPVALTDALMISHVYGWGPFTENGCPAAANLLQDTSAFYSDNGYAKYADVKRQFDLLNYGKLLQPKYVFNPWVYFIHEQAGIPNAYAYSVDDAVGNIQAEGEGIIIDIGSTKHLENQLPASPPISIGFGGQEGGVNFARYSVCNDTNWKPTRSFFRSFIINANNPQKCPVYFEDDKVPAQRYTFTVMEDPHKFPLITEPTKQSWYPDTTAKPIACTGNVGSAPYEESSLQWCCFRLPNDANGNKSGFGVFAFRTIDPATALPVYNVSTRPPSVTTSDDPKPGPEQYTCTQGVKWP